MHTNRSLIGSVSAKRAALFSIPLLVLPFLTLGFWALGGGRKDEDKGRSLSALNLELPNAILKKEAGEDKLGFYTKAEADSAKQQAQIKNDPFFQMAFPTSGSCSGENRDTAFNSMPSASETAVDDNEQAVYRKLNALNQQLQQTQSAPPRGSQRLEADTAPLEMHPVKDSHLQRLEQILSQQEEREPADPQITQLGVLLDKIMAVQHPQATTHAERECLALDNGIYYVSKTAVPAHVSLLDTTQDSTSAESKFFDANPTAPPEASNAIEAVVDRTQRLSDGATIKLRLRHDVSIHQVSIPKETFVFGIVTLRGERLLITIHSVRYKRSLFPVQLDAYDFDGQLGLYVPGTTNTTGPVAGHAMELLNLASLDPSVKAQAATAGLNAVKSMLSKKIKKEHVTIQAGYTILLKQKL